MRTPARAQESAGSPSESKRASGVYDEVIGIWSTLSSIVDGAQGVSIRSRQFETAVHGAGHRYRLLERKRQGTERGVTGAVGLHGKIQGRSPTKSYVTCVGRYRGRCCERSLKGHSLGQRCLGRDGNRSLPRAPVILEVSS